MIDYRMPVADMLFALEHGAQASRLPDWDGELAAAILTEAAKFIDNEVAPLDVLADSDPARLDADGRVRLPEPFVAVYRHLAEAGWAGLTTPEEHGGQGLPHVLYSAFSEALTGACIGFQTIPSLAQAAMRALIHHGTEAQKAAYLPRLASGEWLATMVLTEPQAGSDLGLGRTTATQQADGSWSITGGKIFITAADQNLTDNILHLVLCRCAGAGEGVKGLGLFLCPAVLPDGTRNAIQVLRLEEKMGLHVSPTCQVAFDGARAEIIGGPGEGLARMFTMMNAERLDVGIQGVGLMEVAGQRARAYAAERRQGRGSDGGTVPINRHADVKRMLLDQMTWTLGCRTLCYRAAVDLELPERRALVEFLTPVCKALSTDAAQAVASHAIQVHGGYGYLKEYRVEQVYRDGRITPIYEGTNGIQAMTLIGRNLRADNGAGPAAFKAVALAAAAAAPDSLGRAVCDALGHWERATDAALDLPDPGAVATAYLRLTGLLALGMVWGRLAAAADKAPNPARIRACAAYLRDVLLPETAVLADRVAAGRTLARDWDAAAFTDP